MALQEDKIKGMKHFANKLWNIARYVLAHDFAIGDTAMEHLSKVPEPETAADSEILTGLEETRQAVHAAVESYKLHEAAQALYDFIWKSFADVYIEKSKDQLNANTKHILFYVLTESLHLLHPFMPFITEIIWKKVRENSKLAAIDQVLIVRSLK
jgi:valyl-tRNA synthetase